MKKRRWSTWNGSDNDSANLPWGLAIICQSIGAVIGWAIIFACWDVIVDITNL